MKLTRVYSFFILILYVLITQGAIAQGSRPKTYKLFVNLEKAPFDSLYLQDYTADRNILIPGNKTGNFTWETTIPDEIVKDSQTMQLLASQYDSKTNSQKLVRFISKGAQKNVTVVNVGVEGYDNYIYGSYLDTTLFPNDYFKVKMGNKDSLISGNIICENFELLIKDENSDIAIRAQDPFFSWFLEARDKKISYESQLASYIELARKFPDSRYLMCYLSDNLTRYKSKDDILKVYESFSNKHKNTLWSKMIEEFIYNKHFPNSSLPNNKSAYEKIIQDSTKYNLIAFTASWCAPCMAEIPLLKKIYKDLGRELILTYISIDNKQGVNTFAKKAKEKGITWRTLFAYENIEKTRQSYFVESIPHLILVYPNQTTEIIDIRKDADRSKLYSLVKAFGTKK